MKIYDSIPIINNSNLNVNSLLYPFNLDMYHESYIDHYSKIHKSKYTNEHLELKIKKMHEKLNISAIEYTKFATELMNRFMYLHNNKQNQFIIEIKSADDFTQMQRNALDNFVYVLKIKGWYVKIKEYEIIDDNIIDKTITFYIDLYIDSYSFSKL